MSFTTYIESWSQTSPTTLVQDMIAKGALTKNTRLVLAFASFNFVDATYIPGLQHMTMSDVLNLVALVHAAGAQISLSVGGATYGFANSDLYSEPGALAANINAVLTSCGFDGVDFDIEDPSSTAPADFANQAASIINTLRSINPTLYITLTTPAQAWAPDMYQQNLLNLTITNLDAWQPMEYDLWLDPANTYPNQILWDLNFYMTTWAVPSDKISLGLMPGHDDEDHLLTLQDALNITAQAKVQGLMTWDINIDSKGIDGNAPYAFTMGIQSLLKKTQPSCCAIV